jgi:hypothetical protein
MKETPFTKSLRDFVKNHNGGSIKLGASMFLPKGTPDTIYFYTYTFLLESKVYPNTASDIQLEQISRIRNAGGFAWVCTLMKDGIIMLDDISFGGVGLMFNHIKEYIQNELAKRV